MKKDVTFKHLPIDALRRGQYQPRRAFDEALLVELAESIKAQGIIEPIIVRPLSLNHYEIIAGERRFRAAQIAQCTEVPCIIRNYSDEEAAEVTLIENIQRADLNPIEEATALLCLIDDFFYTHEEVAAAVGKSRTKVTNMLRLLNLDSHVQQLLIDKKITEGHGKILVSLTTFEQIEFANETVRQEWSVRQLEHALKVQKNPSKREAPVDPNIKRLEKCASDHFGAEVVLENTEKSAGWLKLRYQNLDVLSGLLDKMGIEYDR
jgi:ParB family chromosome partitioning protein